MKKALLLAKEAFEKGEIPVGAVIVRNGEIIAEGRNRREEKQNALSHAEIEAINCACKKLGAWRLDDCEIYVTLEPCPMCMGAILNARLKTVVFGAFDSRAGSAESVIDLQNRFELSNPEIFGGICEEECENLLKDFFVTVRSHGRKE